MERKVRLVSVIVPLFLLLSAAVSCAGPEPTAEGATPPPQPTATATPRGDPWLGTIFITGKGQTGVWNIYQLDLETGRVELVIQNGEQPAVSEGRIAFRRWDVATQTYNIWVRDGEGVETQLTKSCWAERPSWSPDGKEIVHWNIEQGMCIKSLDDSTVVPLGLESDGRLLRTDPYWGASGCWIYFVRSNKEQTYLARMDRETMCEEAVPGTEGVIRFAVNDEETRIVFSVKTGRHGCINKLDLSTGEIEGLTRGGPMDGFAFSPNTPHYAVVSNGTLYILGLGNDRTIYNAHPDQVGNVKDPIWVAAR